MRVVFQMILPYHLNEVGGHVMTTKMISFCRQQQKRLMVRMSGGGGGCCGGDGGDAPPRGDANQSWISLEPH